MGCGSSQEECAEKGHPLAALLPQNVTPEERTRRSRELEKLQVEYVTGHNDWEPPFIEKLPDQETSLKTDVHFLHMFMTLPEQLGMEINKTLALAKGDISEEDPFRDFEDVYPLEMTIHGFRRERPPVSKNWREDKEFGRQRLNGISPMMIRKYISAEYKEKFPITDDLVSGLLPEGETLESLEAASRLYVLDFQELDGIESLGWQPPKCWFVVPICLFFVNDNKDLMPLGIQLAQQPEKSPLFTPTDDKGVWTLAKMYVQQMDVCYHIVAEHIGMTHLWAPQFWMSCQRRLAEEHPMHQLLKQHYWFTTGLSVSVREHLISPDGDMVTLFAQGYDGMKEMFRRRCKKTDYHRLHPMFDFKARGVDDPEKLPGYHFRDDMIANFTIIDRFASKLVDLTYPCDLAVREDTELQAFAADIHYKNDWVNFPFTNENFETVQQVKDFFAFVIFYVTSRHGGIHNVAYDMLGFIPNAPHMMRNPPPERKDMTISDLQIAKSWLPEWDMMIRQISFFHGVTIPPDEGKSLGNINDDFMGQLHKNSAQAVETFREELKARSTEVEERNAQLEVPYNYANPKQIWRSICV